MATVQPFIEKLKKNREQRDARKRADAIRKWNDPVLKQVCAPVEVGQDVSGIIERMRDAMAGIGVGLAAPQIGEALRIILIAPSGWHPMPMINPEIVSASKEMEMGEEGCLSYPGVIARINRHLKITVQYLRVDGYMERTELSGFPARIAQHEIDHLNGICRVGDAWRRKRHSGATAALVTAGLLASMGGMR